MATSISLTRALDGIDVMQRPKKRQKDSRKTFVRDLATVKAHAQALQSALRRAPCNKPLFGFIKFIQWQGCHVWQAKRQVSQFIEKVDHRINSVKEDIRHVYTTQTDYQRRKLRHAAADLAKTLAKSSVWGISQGVSETAGELLPLFRYVSSQTLPVPKSTIYMKSANLCQYEVKIARLRRAWNDDLTTEKQMALIKAYAHHQMPEWEEKVTEQITIALNHKSPELINGLVGEIVLAMNDEHPERELHNRIRPLFMRACVASIQQHIKKGELDKAREKIRYFDKVYTAMPAGQELRRYDTSQHDIGAKYHTLIAKDYQTRAEEIQTQPPSASMDPTFEPVSQEVSDSLASLRATLEKHSTTENSFALIIAIATYQPKNWEKELTTLFSDLLENNQEMTLKTVKRQLKQQRMLFQRCREPLTMALCQRAEKSEIAKLARQSTLQTHAIQLCEQIIDETPEGKDKRQLRVYLLNLRAKLETKKAAYHSNALAAVLKHRAKEAQILTTTDEGAVKYPRLSPLASTPTAPSTTEGETVMTVEAA